MKDDRTFVDRLSVEASLWVLVVAVALGLRLAQLGAAPLTAPEAREAMLAWRAATGQGIPAVDYNPLLVSANALFFSLFGTSDVLARLIPALFGAILSLSPALFRHHLGRIGALAAGLYLAVSPTALVASRQLAGTAIAASGTMACVGGTVCFFETKSKGWLTLAAVGLGLAVTSGATAYALLVPLGLAWVVVSRPWLEEHRSRLRDCVRTVRPHVSRFLLAFALVVLILSTGAGWNLSGIGATGGLLADWFGRFRSASSPPVSSVTLLMVYELFGLTFGIGGLIWGMLRGRSVVGLAGLWFGLEVLLLALMPGRTPTDLLWAVLPLASLTGLAVEALLRAWSPHDRVLSAAHGALVLVVWAYGYLMVGRYSAFGDQADLALAMMAVVVQVLLGLSFGLALGPLGALRTVAAATGVALLALTLSAGWGVAFSHPADPREPLLTEPTDPGIHSLVRTLEGLSWEQTGMPYTLDFVFEAPEHSVLAWYLRGFAGARRVDALGDFNGDSLDVILATSGRESEVSPAVEKAYLGQDFTIRTRWSPRALECRLWESSCSAAFSWLLFRDVPLLPDPVQRATLWRLVDGAHFD
jgi:uncharacterized protein (TIGR03663 family)